MDRKTQCLRILCYPFRATIIVSKLCLPIAYDGLLNEKHRTYIPDFDTHTDTLAGATDSKMPKRVTNTCVFVPLTKSDKSRSHRPPQEYVISSIGRLLDHLMSKAKVQTLSSSTTSTRYHPKHLPDTQALRFNTAFCKLRYANFTHRYKQLRENY